MVDLVTGAGCQDDNAFQNRDDKLCVQTRLQEGVKSCLLHDLLKLVKLHLLTQSTSEPHPHVVELYS